MTIFSLYIFDRHTECVYYQDWNRSKPVRPPVPALLKPNVARFDPAVLARQQPVDPNNLPRTDGNGQPIQGLLAHHAVMQRADVLGIGEAGKNAGLAFDEECKLVYGVLLSLRNMVKKLSGKNELFQSYRTSAYKFHFFETLSGYKFILLSDPLADNMQFVLKSIYSGPFLDFVVRNDLVGVRGGGLDESWGVEAQKGKIRGKGIDNDRFRTAVDRYIRGLSNYSA